MAGSVDCPTTDEYIECLDATAARRAVLMTAGRDLITRALTTSELLAPRACLLKNAGSGRDC
jgi:hypothetical protein